MKTNWTVESFRDSRGNSIIEDWMAELNGSGNQAAVTSLIRKLITLRERGLEMTDSPSLTNSRDGLFELRTQTNRTYYRVLLYQAGPRTLVLLHGFVKTTNATSIADLEKAFRRRDADRKRRA